MFVWEWVRSLSGQHSDRHMLGHENKVLASDLGYLENEGGAEVLPVLLLKLPSAIWFKAPITDPARSTIDHLGRFEETSSAL